MDTLMVLPNLLAACRCKISRGVIKKRVLIIIYHNLGHTNVCLSRFLDWESPIQTCPWSAGTFLRRHQEHLSWKRFWHRLPETRREIFADDSCVERRVVSLNVLNLWYGSATFTFASTLPCPVRLELWHMPACARDHPCLQGCARHAQQSLVCTKRPVGHWDAAFAGRVTGALTRDLSLFGQHAACRCVHNQSSVAWGWWEILLGYIDWALDTSDTHLCVICLRNNTIYLKLSPATRCLWKNDTGHRPCVYEITPPTR